MKLKKIATLHNDDAPRKIFFARSGRVLSEEEVRFVERGTALMKALAKDPTDTDTKAAYGKWLNEFERLKESKS